jgi:hypothetical protein
VSDQHEMSAPSESNGSEPGFTWHPVHRGKSFNRVHGELVEEIGRDQRSYKLAMDEAEGAEHDSLTTIVELERRWSIYDFDWAEMDPKALANRILAFEQEREHRQEMIPFADYRASGALVSSNSPASTQQSGGLSLAPGKAAIVAIAVAVVVILVILAVVL